MAELPSNLLRRAGSDVRFSLGGMENPRVTHDPHFAALQNMYLAAPIDAFYVPDIDVSDGGAAAYTCTASCPD